MNLLVIIIALALNTYLVVGGRDHDWDKGRGDKFRDGGGRGGGGRGGGGRGGGGRDGGSGKSKENPPTNCLECAHNVDEVIDGIKENLAKDEPVSFKGIDPCNECYFTGGSTMSGQSDACVKKDKKQCLLQDFTVKFDHITIICNCTLPGGIQKFVKIIGGSANAIGKMFCDVSKNEDKNEKHMYTPKNPAQFPGCVPKADSLVSSGLPTSDDSGSATAGATWTDVVTKVVIKRCKKKLPKLQEVEILNTNFDHIVTHCKTEEPKVKATCQCCGESDLLKSILIKAAEKLIPCLINTKDDQAKSILKELQCDADSLRK